MTKYGTIKFINYDFNEAYQISRVAQLLPL